jgi:flagellin
MKIQTNTAANSALGYTRINAQNTERSMQKLSSGFRINRAGDDAAGLAIANKLRNTGKALQQAQRNASQATAMLQVADGGAQSIATILDRMKELAAAAASDNIGSGADDQRAKLKTEYTALNDEIGRIISTTKYQGVALLSGATSATTKSVDAASTILTDQGTDTSKVTVNDKAVAGTYTINVLARNGDGTGADDSAIIELTDGTNTQQLMVKNGAQSLNFDKLGITIDTTAAFNIGDADGADDVLADDPLTAGTDESADNGVMSFEGKTVVVASAAGGTPMDVLVGATGDPSGADRITLDLAALTNITLGAGNDLRDMSAARQAMTDVDTKLEAVNSFLGKLGSLQSRVDFAANNTATMLQNTQAAESTIRDADMAFEMTQFTKNNILSQAAQSMLSQANQGSQGILQLLRG